jgi:hypothetical protein
MDLLGVSQEADDLCFERFSSLFTYLTISILRFSSLILFLGLIKVVNGEVIGRFACLLALQVVLVGPMFDQVLYSVQ